MPCIQEKRKKAYQNNDRKDHKPPVFLGMAYDLAMCKKVADASCRSVYSAKGHEDGACCPLPEGKNRSCRSEQGSQAFVLGKAVRAAEKGCRQKEEYEDEKRFK